MLVMQGDIFISGAKLNIDGCAKIGEQVVGSVEIINLPLLLDMFLRNWPR